MSELSNYLTVDFREEAPDPALVFTGTTLFQACSVNNALGASTQSFPPSSQILRVLRVDDLYADLEAYKTGLLATSKDDG